MNTESRICDWSSDAQSWICDSSTSVLLDTRLQQQQQSLIPTRYGGLHVLYDAIVLYE